MSGDEGVLRLRDVDGIEPELVSASPMIRRLLCISAFLCTALIPATGDAAQAADRGPGAGCRELARLAAPAYRVDRAEWVMAGPAGAGPGGAAVELPAHCLFQVVMDPRPSNIEGVTFGTGIEIRLPLEWNGRLLFQGGGGLNGVLNPALGNVPGARPALARGFAVVSSDGGHRGRSALDSSFSVDQQAKLDFAYQAVQRATREARSLIERYYGRRPERSYFMGCSTGGREAMLAAQRLPLEFDGVVAGNPTFNLTRVAVNQVWSLQVVNRIAPRDASGRPQLSAAFTDGQLQAVAAAVLQRCDALDGIADGLVNDHRACAFDPGVVQCGAPGAPQAPACLSAPQVGALRDIFGGARDSRGRSLYGAAPIDTGIALPAWRGMHLGIGANPPANASLGRDTLRLFSVTPAAPDLDPLAFDFDRAAEETAETAAINDAVGTLHSTFAGRGGKLIVYHGLSDQALWAGALTGWYERLTPQTGAGPQDWARLFLVPGMAHCGGGRATDEFDMLEAIQNWVEQGRAPDRIVASGRSFPETSRPLCPYPQIARFEGGDARDHRSFACR